MLKKNLKAKKTRSGKTSPSEQKVKTLFRTITVDKAFHFYEGIDKPTGHVATSLLDFCNIISDSQSDQLNSSLVFHQKRGDFSNWIREVLGDFELAETISKVKPDDSELRSKLCKTINTRINELKDTMQTYTLIPEDAPSLHTPTSRP